MIIVTIASADKESSPLSSAVASITYCDCSSRLKEVAGKMLPEALIVKSVELRVYVICKICD